MSDLTGLIPLLVGACFFFGYILDRRADMERPVQESMDERSFPPRYLWLGLAMVLFTLSFFMDAQVFSSTTSTPTALINGTVVARTTYVYSPNTPLFYFGGFMLILILVLLVLSTIGKTIGNLWKGAKGWRF